MNQTKEPTTEATTTGPPQTAIVDLDDGEQLEFGRVVAWDIIAIKREMGAALSQLDPFEASLALAWRSAVQGGFPGDFENFCGIIPLDRLQEITQAIAPFLGKRIAALVGAASSS